MEDNLKRIRELIDQKEVIDNELTALIGGQSVVAKPATKGAKKCGTCGQPGHNTATCPTKPNGHDTERPMEAATEGGFGTAG